VTEAKPPPTIWLASKSPRRGELLAQIGVAFDVLRLREGAGRTPDVPEVAHDGEPPLHYVERIARTKANVGWQSMIARRLAERPVLGADTEVILDGEVFGKPADERAAKAMLARLAGRTHEVVTAVALRWRDVDVEGDARAALQGGDRRLRRERRAVRQGRRLRHPGARRRLRDAPRRELLGRHGPAARRDGRPARQGGFSRTMTGTPVSGTRLAPGE
jgi:hypothetical protein